MPSSYYKTGSLRQQALLLPARIEDYVGRNNAVRAIEAYVASLDLAKLRFRHAVRVAGAGQPPYDPADLLKLYLYGYTPNSAEIRKNLLPTAAGAILVRR